MGHLRSEDRCTQGRKNGGGQGGQVPTSFQKCPFSGGKVPFVFVKNVVQIAFLPQWPLINANIFVPLRQNFFMYPL